jgi:hypothetical protein
MGEELLSFTLPSTIFSLIFTILESTRNAK